MADIKVFFMVEPSKVGDLEFLKQTGHPAQSTNPHPGVGYALRYYRNGKDARIAGICGMPEVINR
ncbi:hypothetical protein [Janthinobacterium tructae]|uniref:Uncharacterized protein n=1 Tax=Janthinobacterium tructae TaxID=2590869 RepID=A0A4Y6RAC9_9BURK|nr:hypothetical protein [Janthinobacterium tructae]QDG69417.1 hypothetical protein FJQ89_02560 [Janthinobacterium tructae]